MIIREEKTEDYLIVENLNRQAFWNLYQKGCSQHYVVHVLRKSLDFIQPLSLVAEENSQIIGHILYTHSKILYKDKKQLPTITFGPVCVHPDHQKKGIGSMLIKESFKRAKSMGFKAVVIAGFPEVYHRFGFKCTKQFNISQGDGTFPVALMALELVEGYLPKDKEGMIIMSQSYEITAASCQQYDKNFPLKEKYLTRSQQVFASMLPIQWNDPYQFSLKDAFDSQKIQEEV